MKRLKYLSVFMLLVLLSGCGLFSKTVTVYVEVPVAIEIPTDFLQQTEIPKRDVGWSETDNQGELLGPYIGKHKQAIKTGNAKLKNIKILVDDFNKKAEEAKKKNDNTK